MKLLYCSDVPKMLPLFQGYLKSLGMSRTAQVKRDARIGEAEARRDATVKVKHSCQTPVVRKITKLTCYTFILFLVQM